MDLPAAHTLSFLEGIIFSGSPKSQSDSSKKKKKIPALQICLRKWTRAHCHGTMVKSVIKGSKIYKALSKGYMAFPFPQKL